MIAATRPSAASARCFFAAGVSGADDASGVPHRSFAPEPRAPAAVAEPAPALRALPCAAGESCEPLQAGSNASTTRYLITISRPL